jgi:hypothetical protein
MLPEVWVCVSGLPSDIKSDYLSLWGVGTLFGKTLDVDMTYTRNNKVLRTKIGCLDRNLIPTDSDVFIRRGFFKLHFEVETTLESQEVNMAEANNGNDGSDDAHQGEGNNGGGNAMDMDPKGLDEGNTSNNGQDGSFENNGVDGMQVQVNHNDEIQIVTNVQISPTGIPHVAQNFDKKSLFFKPISHVKNLVPNDSFCTNSHVDGRSGAAGRVLLHAPKAALHQVADSLMPRPIIGVQRSDHLVGRVEGSRTGECTVQRAPPIAASLVADSLQPRPISGLKRADHRGGCQRRGYRVPGDMCSRVGAGSKARRIWCGCAHRTNGAGRGPIVAQDLAWQCCCSWVCQGGRQ